MKVKDVIKKQTTLVALAVIGVAITVIGISYAVFFDVKDGDTQVITAGTLDVSLSGVTENSLNLNEPKTTADGLKTTGINYSAKNDGNLPATYKVYVYADSDNQIELSKIMFSTDGTSSKLLTSVTPITLSLDGGGTVQGYEISSDVVAAKQTSTTKNLKMWIDEGSLTDDLNSVKISLGLCIVSEVNEA